MYRGALVDMTGDYGAYPRSNEGQHRTVQQLVHRLHDGGPGDIRRRGLAERRFKWKRARTSQLSPRPPYHQTSSRGRRLCLARRMSKSSRAAGTSATQPGLGNTTRACSGGCLSGTSDCRLTRPPTADLSIPHLLTATLLLMHILAISSTAARYCARHTPAVLVVQPAAPSCRLSLATIVHDAGWSTEAGQASLPVQSLQPSSAAVSSSCPLSSALPPGPDRPSPPTRATGRDLRCSKLLPLTIPICSPLASPLPANQSGSLVPGQH